MKYRITKTTAYAFPKGAPGKDIERVIKAHDDGWNAEWVRYERPTTNEVVYKTARMKVIDSTPSAATSAVPPAVPRA